MIVAESTRRSVPLVASKSRHASITTRSMWFSRCAIIVATESSLHVTYAMYEVVNATHVSRFSFLYYYLSVRKTRFKRQPLIVVNRERANQDRVITTLISLFWKIFKIRPQKKHIIHHVRIHSCDICQ